MKHTIYCVIICVLIAISCQNQEKSDTQENIKSDTLLQDSTNALLKDTSQSQYIPQAKKKIVFTDKCNRWKS